MRFFPRTAIVIVAASGIDTASPRRLALMATCAVTAVLMVGLAGSGIAHADPAAPRLFLEADGFICPEMDSLTGQTVDYKLTRGRCFSGLVKPTPVVVLDADYPFAYVCTLFRNFAVVVDGRKGKRNAVMCGYAIQRELKDERGTDQGYRDVEQAARHSSMADVHRLP